MDRISVYTSTGLSVLELLIRIETYMDRISVYTSTGLSVLELLIRIETYTDRLSTYTSTFFIHFKIIYFKVIYPGYKFSLETVLQLTLQKTTYKIKKLFTTKFTIKDRNMAKSKMYI